LEIARILLDASFRILQSPFREQKTARQGKSQAQEAVTILILVKALEVHRARHNE
jgi:hypothetical protein